MTPFHLACLSDLHLGHRRNDTAIMIKALDESIFNHGLLSRIKLLMLAGDVFDGLLELNHPNLADIDHWINRLLRACVQHGVSLIVLEGTPSHDRRQSERFETVYKLTRSTCDFKYVTKIDIVRVEKLGIDVLCVPDEASATTQDTQEVVKALLESRGLTQVDIACMHGYFQYQIPYQTKDTHYHNEEFYRNITRYWIVIGHVHKHTRSGKIIAQGSHDRLNHGEEEPKGFIEASVGEAQGDQMWFIENKLAHSYVTIKVYDLEVGVSFDKIDEALKDVGDFAHIRIEAEPEHPIFEHMVELQKKYPTMCFIKHPKKASEGDPLIEASKEPEIVKWHAIRIDRENITTLLDERFTNKGIDIMTHERAMHHLQECL